MHVVSLVLQTLLTLMFLMAGFGKMTGSKTSIEEFKTLRLPQWIRVVTGVVEFVSAAALIIGYWYASWTVVGALLIVIFSICGTMAMVRVKEPFKNMIVILVIAVLAIILFLINIEDFSNFLGLN